MSKRLSEPLPTIIFVLSIVGLSLWQLYCVRSDGWLIMPPKPIGDGPDYENIGFHLWQNNEYAMNWQDATWQQPYLRSQGPAAELLTGSNVEAYSVQLSRTDAWSLTTARPPLLPLIIAGLYSVFDRTPQAFEKLREVLALSIACAGALAAYLSTAVLRRQGSHWFAIFVGGSVTLALAAMDRTVRTYATDFLTEPLALLLTQLFVLAWFRMANDPHKHSVADNKRPRTKLLVLMGVLLAALIAARSILIFWLPGLAVALVTVDSLRDKVQPNGSLSNQAISNHGPTQSLWSRLAKPATCLAICLICLAPWWVRNCVVLGTFMPLGTQGSISLLGGYCDEALGDSGQWRVEAEERLRGAWQDQHRDAQPQTIIEREISVSNAAAREISSWASQHWTSLPWLCVTRVITEWNPYSGRSLIVKGLVLLGIVTLIMRRQYQTVALFASLLIINSLVVACTYSVGGRFNVPLYGILYTLAGIGVGNVVEWLWRVCVAPSPISGLADHTQQPRPTPSNIAP